jgi:hypothetical protein
LLLGTMTDYELGRRLRRPNAEVREQRLACRIAPFKPAPKSRPWATWEIKLLGTMRDADLAAQLDRTVEAVKLCRAREKIPVFDSLCRRWTPAEDALLGTMRDEVLAQQLHRPLLGVRQRRLHKNPDRHVWTPADEQLLGQRPDDQVALLLGTTLKAVQHRRSMLDRPPCPLQQQANPSPWTAEEDQIVRIQEITEAARQLQRTRSAVLNRRRTLGVCAIVRREWTPEQDQLFSRLNDREIAQQLGRTQSSVENRRTRLKIPVPKPGWRFFSAEEDALLGTATDAEIAERLGRHPSSIQSRRLRLGLRKGNPRVRRPWTPEEDAILGTASDSEIAARLNRHIATVCIRRQKLGIPNFYWQQRSGRQRNMKARP